MRIQGFGVEIWGLGFRGEELGIRLWGFDSR